MTRRLRRSHRLIWWVLTPVLVVIIAVALFVKPESLPEATDDSAANLVLDEADASFPFRTDVDDAADRYDQDPDDTDDREGGAP